MNQKYSHGGDIYKYNREMLDFSANINPLGMPSKAKKAIVENIEAYYTYPDYANRDLIHHLKRHYRIENQQVVCGNGAADLIYRLVISEKPQASLILAPTFSEYEEALNLVNCKVNYHYLKEENNFKLDDTILDAINDDIDIVFICSPNNPTGRPTEKDLIEKILLKSKCVETLVVVDQCFMDFIINEEEFSAISLLDKFDNLIILEAATKIFAMAGLRLGYLFTANKSLADRIRKVLQPWSVSTVASKAGIAALNEDAFIDKTKKYILEQREFLNMELENLDIKVYPAWANYMLIKADKYLGQDLESQGILIRYCSNYVGLDNSYYRLAVKKKEDNIKLIEAIRKLR